MKEKQEKRIISTDSFDDTTNISNLYHNCFLSVLQRVLFLLLSITFA